MGSVGRRASSTGARARKIRAPPRFRGCRGHDGAGNVRPRGGRRARATSRVPSLPPPSSLTSRGAPCPAHRALRDATDPHVHVASSRGRVPGSDTDARFFKVVASTLAKTVRRRREGRGRFLVWVTSQHFLSIPFVKIACIVISDINSAALARLLLDSCSTPARLLLDRSLLVSR